MFNQILRKHSKLLWSIMILQRVENLRIFAKLRQKEQDALDQEKFASLTNFDGCANVPNCTQKIEQW